MGLYEKRLLVRYQDYFKNKVLPKLKTTSGLKLEVEVEWDSIYNQVNRTDPDLQRVDYDYLERYMDLVFLTPVQDAIAAVASDKIGKEALIKALKKLKFLTDGTHHGHEAAITFGNGTITINQDSYTDGRESAAMTEFLTALLEKNL